ncbi:hypothetical protein JH26_09655 [Microvirga sp. BSC39]|nr:hypothetical protein JH26_09655 [Microvirga sp. BSC39]
MWVLGMPVGDAALRQLVGLRSHMEDPLPGDLPRSDAFRSCGHVFGTEIGGDRPFPGQHGRNALRRFLGADVREAIGNSGPGMNLHQEIRNLDQRVHVAKLPLQLLGGDRYIAGQGSDNELPRIEPNTFELAIAGAASSH